MGDGARKRQQVLDQVAAAAALRCDQFQALHRLVMFFPRDLAGSHPLPQQFRISQNPGERIIDFVRHHRRHLSDRRHLLHMQHVIVGAFEFLCLLLHAVFQRLGPGNDLFIRRAQLQAHAVEGVGQVADFILRSHLDLITEFALGQMSVPS